VWGGRKKPPEVLLDGDFSKNRGTLIYNQKDFLGEFIRTLVCGEEEPCADTGKWCVQRGEGRKNIHVLRRFRDTSEGTENKGGRGRKSYLRKREPSRKIPR